MVEACAEFHSRAKLYSAEPVEVGASFGVWGGEPIFGLPAWFGRGPSVLPFLGDQIHYPLLGPVLGLWFMEPGGPRLVGSLFSQNIR